MAGLEGYFATSSKEWDLIEEGIKKLRDMLETNPEKKLRPGEFLAVYKAVYDLAGGVGVASPTQCQGLYDRYRGSMDEYISTTVLPSLRGIPEEESMLREFVKRWKNHKIMVRWMCMFFEYLKRYYVERLQLPKLKEAGFSRFRDLVYLEFRGRVRDATISMIDREREGVQIDRGLVKGVVDVFVEIGMGNLDYYHNDFEAPMLDDTAAFYSHKASTTLGDSDASSGKVEEYLQQEKERVSHYLHPRSETELLKRVERGVIMHE